MISFIAKLHSNETQFYQPNFSRSRQALRSPRVSEELNLETSLFRYDVFKLYEKIDTMETTMAADFKIMNSGDSSIYNITHSGAATPSSVIIPSLESIASRMEGFSSRLEVLEKGLV